MLCQEALINPLWTIFGQYYQRSWYSGTRQWLGADQSNCRIGLPRTCVHSLSKVYLATCTWRERLEALQRPQDRGRLQALSLEAKPLRPSTYQKWVDTSHDTPYGQQLNREPHRNRGSFTFKKEMSVCLSTEKSKCTHWGRSWTLGLAGWVILESEE